MRSDTKFMVGLSYVVQCFAVGEYNWLLQCTCGQFIRAETESTQCKCGRPWREIPVESLKTSEEIESFRRRLLE